MFAVYEFEFFEDEGWVVAMPFDLEGGTQGRDIAEASRMAADWLKGEVEHALMCGTELPSPTFGNTQQHGGRVGVVAVEASLETVDCVTASEAADMLGVSRSRVSQMLASGQLEGWKRGASTFVTCASVRARLAECPRPGRPRKDTLDRTLIPA